ncbi:hypothetical protein QQY66_01520 [Streptomyces sp. DG2A-72]|uniref:hypothetical protein n=1 Tax=Streptomyces sp. DG2A-72 TaxID=3051386 RepID=UPI00265C7EC3|nr:hypothetical protein [Streptomyces sp. DG2A-72]MDO0930441.1 hypothetical protein [Streptomyces sp. DG2A-72]
MTNVPMATALVATQPVWQALISTLQGTRLPRATWADLTVSVVGAAAVSGVDVRAGARIQRRTRPVPRPGPTGFPSSHCST